MNNKNYYKLTKTINNEREIMDVISLCFDNNTRNVIIEQEYLSDEFFNLKSGLAGIVLQKFIDYKIKVAVVLDDKSKINERFSELILELNKRNDFRFFDTFKEAENFMMNLN